MNIFVLCIPGIVRGTIFTFDNNKLMLFFQYIGKVLIRFEQCRNIFAFIIPTGIQNKIIIDLKFS